MKQYCRKPRIPTKILIRESRKMFFGLLFGAVLISSLQDFDPKTLLVKFITLSALFFIIFAINTFLINYFDRYRKDENERIWKKIFACGYFISFAVFVAHHELVLYMHDAGILVQGNIEDIREKFGGWKSLAFMMYANFVIYTFVFLIQNFVLVQYEKSSIQVELLELKNSNAETVNQLLQQQIKPHFLFNALNILKSLIRREPKLAEKYLLRLSDFLRVSITENKTGLATVKDELKVCSDYMEMQKIRFGEALQYQVNIDDSSPVLNGTLPFFSIQPLLENAIKHNELTEDNPLSIRIDVEGNELLVSNNLQLQKSKEVSTGNGHRILKERYKIISGDEVKIEETEDTFTIRLKILDV